MVPPGRINVPNSTMFGVSVEWVLGETAAILGLQTDFLGGNEPNLCGSDLNGNVRLQFSGGNPRARRGNPRSRCMDSCADAR
jgi:hypothetical protein